MFTGILPVLSRAALALVALMVGGSALVAVYEAPEPGAALEPVGSAAEIVTLDQDATSVRFETFDALVDQVAIQGWPTQVAGNELGGALMVVAVGARTGSVEFGEMPRTVEFRLSGRPQPVSR